MDTEPMGRLYTTHWTPDPRHPLRDPACQPAQFRGQPAQGFRLPPPASLLPGASGGHGPSQMHSPQDPRIGPGYQSTDVPASTQHVSHPPPAMGPSHHSSGMSSTQQRQHGLHLVQQPPPDIHSSSSESHQGYQYQNHPIPHRTPEYTTQGSQPSAFAYTPHPRQPWLPSNNNYSDPRQTGTAAMALTSNSASSHTISPTDAHMRDPITISDLLVSESGKGGSTSTMTPSTTASGCPSEPDIKYKLTIRQQPAAARSCGFGERDRRVIDPPPIVQLSIESSRLSEDDIKKRLRYCHYIMSCSILDESGTRDAAFMPEEYRQQRRLMGSLVGAPFVGKDEFGVEGCFFCFPDLSCRTPGSFRLKFSLVMIEPSRAKELRHFPVLVEEISDIFTVYSAKDFPGMQASTKLTKRLKEQGCIISIKKGNDKSKNKAGDDSSDGERDEEGGSSSQGKKQRRSTQR